MEILRTARDAHGLFSLENLFASPPPDAAPFAPPPPHGSGPAAARGDLSRFWQAWFGALFRRLPPEDPRKAWTQVARHHPAAAAAFARSLGALAQALAGVARSGAAALLRDPDFWREVPAPVRPLSGYLQMYVQNAPSRSSLLRAVSLVEQLRAETGE
jgi:hypothetical protein